MRWGDGTRSGRAAAVAASTLAGLPAAVATVALVSRSWGDPDELEPGDRMGLFGLFLLGLAVFPMVGMGTYLVGRNQGWWPGDALVVSLAVLSAAVAACAGVLVVVT